MTGGIERVKEYWCWWGRQSEAHTSRKEHTETLEPRAALLRKVHQLQTYLVAPPVPCTRYIQHELSHGHWISDNMSGFFIEIFPLLKSAHIDTDLM